MPAQKRHKTDYAGVYFIWGTHRVSRKPEKIFYATYRKNGKLIDEKIGRSSEDITPARASNRRALRMAGKEPTNVEAREAEKANKRAATENWTIAKLWDKYCDIFSTNKALKNEKRKFDLYLRNDIGKKEPRELLPLDVDRLRVGIQKKGKKTTAARVLELLRRSINFGIKRGLVSPISFKIEIPKLNNQTTEDLNPEQLEKLLRVLAAHEDQTATNVMRLALFTGMRRSEILTLRWDKINFERGFISLKDPKGGPDQKIPLNDGAREILSNCPRWGSPYVFPGRNGKKRVDIKTSVRKIRDAAGLPKDFRPIHGLRHAFASMLASSGKVDMFQLQKLLTHKNAQTTQRYAHLRDEVLKNASEVATDIIGDAMNGKEEKKVIKLHRKK